jgi:hypothetical protein
LLPQRELRQVTCTAEVVGQYRIVWLRLSQLASCLGKFYGQQSQLGYCFQIKFGTHIRF